MASSLLTLDIEKPAAGGRMLARHAGQVVLVWGAIPGERVTARVERSGKGVLYAEAVEVLSPSPDRRELTTDWRCGGAAFAHVAYPRQLQLKGEIVRDAFLRIGRMPVAAPDVVGSPEQGYRMRARLHAAGGRLGFYREGTHQLCEAGPTGQLLPETIAWLRTVEETARARGLEGLAALELSENIPPDERACHLELHAGADVNSFAAIADAAPLTGLSAGTVDRPATARLAGVPAVTDRLDVADGVAPLVLRRHARAFFQGNRFLLERFVRHVIGLVPPGPVLDLYAGVGLFGLSLAAAGREGITLVEGDPASGADLQANAEPFASAVSVRSGSVEHFLRGARPPADASFIVDPPRTGMSRDAVREMIARSPARVVYVSCDVATLARDVRAFVDAGYEMTALTSFDLFPNTAHVESVAVLGRAGGH